MRHAWSVAFVIAVALVGLHGVGRAVAQPQATDRPEARLLGPARPRPSRFAAPLVFEKNLGQAPEGWDFLVRCRGYHAFVRPTGVVFSLDGRALSMSIEEALGREPDTAGLALPGRSNYFLGDDPTRWITDVPQFRGARYPETTRGASWRVGGSGRALEFAFDLAPGAEAPRLRFDGQRTLTVGPDGTLAFEMPLGRATISAPIAWQDGPGGARTAVEAAWTLDPDGAARIALGRRDASRGVHVDPSVTYQTYIGGSDDDGPSGAAMDGAGDAYVGGSTNSANFPSTASAYDPSQNGGSGNRYDMYVSKFAAGGASLVYSTFIGAPGDDQCLAFAVDGSGAAYLAGQTFNSGYPVTSGSFNTTKTASGSVGCLTKLAASGAALSYSTFVNQSSRLNLLAVDSTGAAHVVDPGNNLLKFTPSGSGVSWTKAFPSFSGGTALNCVGVASNDDVFVGGSTTSASQATSGAYQTAISGASDAFLTKLASANGSVVFSTLLGGAGSEAALGVGVNLAQQPYVVGRTASANFPVTGDAYQTPSGTSGHVFLTRFKASGAALRYSTCFRGDASETAAGIAVHPSGSCVVAGQTTSATTFPLSGAWQSAFGGGVQDAFVAKFERDGTLAWSSYVGGSGDETATGIGMAPDGSAVVCGFTSSNNCPTVSPYQSAPVGVPEAFVTSIPDSLPTNVAVPSVTTTTLPDWTTGVAFSQQLGVAGGVAPLVWSLAGGTPPGGLSFTTGGLLSGTPTTAGTYSFAVHIADSADLVTSPDRQLTMVINPTPTISTSSLPQWTEGLPFSQPLTFGGGTGALTISLDSGSPPAGTTFGADGRIAGTPTTAGDYSFVARVTDSVGGTSTRTVTGHINAFPSIADATVGPWTQLRPFTQVFSAAGGTGGLTWSLAAGTLPVDAPLDATTGRMSGTTLVNGDYAFTLRVTDALGATIDHAFAMTLNPSPQILTDESLPTAAAGRAYSVTLEGTGGTAPVLWALDTTFGSQPFPNGIGMSAGKIVGTPSIAERKGPTITYTDSCGAVVTRQFFIEVAGALDLTKKKVVETESFVAGTGRVLRRLELVEGTTLTVSLAPVSKKTPIAVDVTLFDSHGAALDLVPWTKTTTKSVTVKNAEIPRTDRWFLAVSPSGSFEGAVKMTVSISAKTTWTGTADVGAAATDLAFAAPPGATAAITVKAAKGSAALPHVVGVLVEDDSDAAAGVVVKEKGKAATLALKAPLAGGGYRLRVTGRDATSGPVVWTVKLKLPKTYSFSLPDLAAGDGR